MEPRITVITVCKNSEKTIEQSIRSVIGQQYPNMQYVIIDGKSTDRTCDIIEAYREYVNSFVCEPDDGVYYAMNKGLSLADGDIIGFMNSDDFYEPGALFLVAEEYRREVSEGIKPGLIYGDANILDDSGEIGVQSGSDISRIRYTIPMCHQSVFTSASLFDEIGFFNTEYKIAADYDHIYRCYNNQAYFKYIPHILANYRIGGLSSDISQCTVEYKRIATSYAKTPELKRAIIEWHDLTVQWDKTKKMINKYCRLIQSDSDAGSATKRKVKSITGNKEVIIFSYGRCGIITAKLLRSLEINVAAFVDNDKEKQKLTYEGIRVLQPNIEQFNGRYVILANVYGEKEIQNQLDALKVDYISIHEFISLIEK